MYTVRTLLRSLFLFFYYFCAHSLVFLWFLCVFLSFLFVFCFSIFFGAVFLCFSLIGRYLVQRAHPSRPSSIKSRGNCASEIRIRRQSDATSTKILWRECWNKRNSHHINKSQNINQQLRKQCKIGVKGYFGSLSINRNRNIEFQATLTSKTPDSSTYAAIIVDLPSEYPPNTSMLHSPQSQFKTINLTHSPSWRFCIAVRLVLSAAYAVRISKL